MGAFGSTSVRKTSDRDALARALSLASEKLLDTQAEALDAWGAKLAEELRLNPRDADDAVELGRRIAIVTDVGRLRQCLTLDGKRATPWVCVALEGTTVRVRLQYVDDEEVRRG